LTVLPHYNNDTNRNVSFFRITLDPALRLLRFSSIPLLLLSLWLAITSLRLRQGIWGQAPGSQPIPLLKPPLRTLGSPWQACGPRHFASGAERCVSDGRPSPSQVWEIGYAKAPHLLKRAEMATSSFAPCACKTSHVESQQTCREAVLFWRCCQL
jgi:hypothetical protein